MQMAGLSLAILTLPTNWQMERRCYPLCICQLSMTSSENWWRKQWRLTNGIAGARQPRAAQDNCKGARFFRDGAGRAPHVP